MLKILILFSILSSLSAPAWGQQLAPCPKNFLRGYNYTGFNAEGDKYLDQAKRVTLYVLCYNNRVQAEEILNKLKADSNPKNMSGEAVYFETATETKNRRIYVVTRKPVMQLTFETKWRNRIWLEATQDLMEKFAARGQKTPIAAKATALKPAAARRKK